MRPELHAVIIGGGITGAGIYRELRRAGLRTTLVEANKQLGSETTFNSSWLIHGGLRYLAYDPNMTAECCRDAGRIRDEFPQLLTRLPFLWPIYEGDKHGLETVESLLEVYDGFSKDKGARPHMRFNAEETLRIEPGLKARGLRGALCFDEWLVDPRRLTAAVAAAATGGDGEILTGREVIGFVQESGRIGGVQLADGTTLRSRWVINASGPWTNRVAALAGLEIPMRLQKGVHLVYPGRLTRCAILAEAVDRKRHIFFIPSGDVTLLGPTDTPFDDDPGAAGAEEADVEYLDASMRRIFPALPAQGLAPRTGVRPILGQSGPEFLLSRDFEVIDHELRDGVQGLVTVTGGKMTAFPSMADAARRLLMYKLGESKAAAPERQRRKLLSIAAAGLGLGAAYLRHQMRGLAKRGAESTLEDFETTYD
ncbi:MAG: FAD-dependent oxidoreductase [Elusimicrobiota bacterium]